MNCMAIRLDSDRLANPDADLRYILPDFLAERSAGVIQEDGYDYVGPTNLMVIYLQVSDLERARGIIVDVLENVRVMENDLRPGTLVAEQRGEKFVVVYPSGCQEEFLP